MCRKSVARYSHFTAAQRKERWCKYFYILHLHVRSTPCTHTTLARYFASRVRDAGAHATRDIPNRETTLETLAPRPRALLATIMPRVLPPFASTAAPRVRAGPARPRRRRPQHSPRLRRRPLRPRGGAGPSHDVRRRRRRRRRSSDHLRPPPPPAQAAGGPLRRASQATG